MDYERRTVLQSIMDIHQIYPLPSYWGSWTSVIFILEGSSQSTYVSVSLLNLIEDLIPLRYTYLYDYNRIDFL